MKYKMILLILIFVTICEGFLNIDQFLITNSTKSRLNLTCSYGNNYIGSQCEYCVYQYYNNGSSLPFISYDCIQIANIYKSISRRCEGFSDQIDIGYGICSPLPFETFDTSILCICATNMCNTNLQSCQSSVTNQVQSNSAPSALPSLLPELSTSISCFDTTISLSNSVNESNYCASTQSPYINLTKCNDYVLKNTVLCAISISGNQSVSIAVTADDYRSAVVDTIEIIYYTSQDPTVQQLFNESSSHIYLFLNITNYYQNSSSSNQRCFCAQNNCNYNLTNCLNANRSLSTTNNATSELI